MQRNIINHAPGLNTQETVFEDGEGIEENFELQPLTDYDQTEYPGTYGSYNKRSLASNALHVGNEGVIDNLMTFLTWFPQLIGSFGFIFLFPIISVTLQFFVGVGKILLNPLMDWWHKSAFISGLIAATALILTPLTSSLFLDFFKVGFFGFKLVAPVAPILFTSALGIFTVMNAYSVVRKGWTMLRHPHHRTPLATLSFWTKLIKTLALAAVTSSIIPLFLALGTFTLLANPFTAGPTAAVLFGIIMFASATLVTLKIVKTIAKHRLQERMAREALEGVKDRDGKEIQKPFNPYAVLGITQKRINEILTAEKTISVVGKEIKLGGFISAILNKRDLKMELATLYDNIKYPYIDPARRNFSPLDSTQAYKLQLAYEMLGHPRGREMFDAFKAVKDMHAKGEPMPELQSRQRQFGVVSSLQKTIPVSWLMRPIAATAYYFQRRNETDPAKLQEMALSYRLATNAALSSYYDTKRTEPRPAPASRASTSTSTPYPTDEDSDNQRDHSFVAAPTRRAPFADGKRPASWNDASIGAGVTHFGRYGSANDTARSMTDDISPRTSPSSSSDDDRQPIEQRRLVIGKYGSTNN